METITNQIHKFLIKSKKTIAVAESCTGGLLSKILTDLPGSSAYFILGVVTYSNKSKVSILNIPSSVISRKGAVSESIAKLMAGAVRKIANSDFGIGITGIAGPTGGSLRKPKGTVFIAVETKFERLCEKFVFKGNRKAIREKAAVKGLELLKNIILKR